MHFESFWWVCLSIIVRLSEFARLLVLCAASRVTYDMAGQGILLGGIEGGE
jgi:hypothetical protein